MASAPSTGSAIPVEAKNPLSSEELRKMHAYWRAANYLWLFRQHPGPKVHLATVARLLRALER